MKQYDAHHMVKPRFNVVWTPEMLEVWEDLTGGGNMYDGFRLKMGWILSETV